MKKIRCFALLLIAAMLLVSCDFGGGMTTPDKPSAQGDEARNEEIYAVYLSYVDNTTSKGGVPQSYEDWLASIRGENGKDGKDGEGFYYCSVCKALKADIIPKYSKGLEYVSKGDGTCYVSGIGTCTDLEVIIPSKSPEGDSVTSIGKGAFRDCISLTSITIPNGVTSIGYNPFRVCSSLESIVSYSSSYPAIGNCLIEASTGTLIAGCKNSVIPTDSSVTSIGIYAFDGCSSLTSIMIPDSVMSLGLFAFRNCSSLTNITISDSVMSIRKYAFYNCPSLTNIIFDGTQARWNAIEKGYLWNYSTGSYVIHCTDGDIPK